MAQRMPLRLTVSCFSKIQIGFSFLVPAYLGSPEQRAVKRLCVCVCFGTIWQKQWSNVHQLFSVLLLCGPLLIFHILSTSVQYRLFEHIKIASSENLTSMLIKNKS